MSDLSSAASGFTSTERRSLLVLALLYMLRMLGLFMIFPVFALYADQLQNATPQRVGLALGIYGFTQALLQIPFGAASDRWGRKPIIIMGLLLFAASSLVAAFANTIEMTILGRALQGSGAIAAAISALVADVTRETHRTRAMAMVGASIGLSFVLALVLGPLLAAWIGVSGIFAVTAGLAFCGIALVQFAVPTVPAVALGSAGSLLSRLGEALSDVQLLRLNAGIFALHAILTANFVVIPLLLRDNLSLSQASHWMVYLPVLLGSLLVMVPAMIYAERRQKIRSSFLLAIAALLLAELALMQFSRSQTESAVWLLLLSLLLFFIAFNFLEANLPALVSRVAAAESKGTAMGVYSTSQFSGTAVGGIFGGWVMGSYGPHAVFLASAVLAFCWLLLSWNMIAPGRQTAAQADSAEAKPTA